MGIFTKKPLNPPRVSIVKGVVVRIANTPYTYIDGDKDRPSLGLLCMLGNLEIPIYVDTDPARNAHARYIQAGDFIDVRKTVEDTENGEKTSYTLERNVSLIEDCNDRREKLLEVLQYLANEKKKNV